MTQPIAEDRHGSPDDAFGAVAATARAPRNAAPGMAHSARGRRPLRLKPLAEQVIVITGASSGIGLATARMAAKQGARLVLAARSGEALERLAAEIHRAGGEALAITADVAKPEDVARIAREAVARFGGFDTWVNNAGVGLYGKLEDCSVEDMRKLFDVNLWGLVHGSLEALRHLRERGGALINLGSVESHRAVALQGAYAASKAAIRAFTDEFRVGVETDRAPVSVSLVKPAAIDTPFPPNAKSTLGSEPQHVPPVYAPDVVAEVILHCAATPTREIYAGGGGKLIAAMARLAPGLTDRVMAYAITPATESGRPPRRGQDANNLDHPTGELAERGTYPGHVAEVSLYSQAAMHPLLSGALLVGGGLAITALLTGRPRHAGARR